MAKINIYPRIYPVAADEQYSALIINPIGLSGESYFYVFSARRSPWRESRKNV